MQKLLLLLAVVFFTFCSCGPDESLQSGNGKSTIFASILPQRFFIKKIAGDRYDVRIIVREGESPATYEPAPHQMAELSKAKVYFSIGVPFEKAWLHRIAGAGKKMLLVDTSESITKRQVKDHSQIIKSIEGAVGKTDSSHKHLKDPHIWLDPLLVIKQAKKIAETFVLIDPDNAGIYQANLKKFRTELSSLNTGLSDLFRNKKNRLFFVFHPSWGYFADRYKLIQVPVELQGRNPGPRELSSIINIIKKRGGDTIFVQKEFSTSEAETIASALNGRVEVIDPLSEDYINNLVFTAQKIADSME